MVAADEQGVLRIQMGEETETAAEDKGFPTLLQQ